MDKPHIIKTLIAAVFAICSFTVSANTTTGKSASELFDIADQGLVVTWDSYDPASRYPRRTEELEIDDLFFDRFVFPQEDGTYILPTTPTTGYGIIGLQWYGKRFVSQLYIEFANPERIPDAKTVKLEYWIGDSIFAGHWAPLPGELSTEAKGLRYIIGNNCKASTQGTFKIRWCFSSAVPSYLFTALKALADIPRQHATLNVQFENHTDPVAIQVYNAKLVEPQGRPDQRLLEPSKTHTLTLDYSLHGNRHTERSLITFDLPEYPFAVAVCDVLDKGPVYVEDLGIFVAAADSGITLKQYKDEIAARQTTLDQIRRMPDQSFQAVMSTAHPKIQNNGPAMLSLACDNNKFVLRQDGSIRYMQHLEAPPSHRKSERGHTDEFRKDIVELIPLFGSLNTSSHPHRGWPWFTAKKYPGQERSLEGSFYPAPLNTIKDEGIVYTQKTFVAPSGAPLPKDPTGFYNNQPLLVSRFTIENPGPQPESASLALQFVTDMRTNTPARVRKLFGGFAAVNSDRLLAFIRTDKSNFLTARVVNQQVVISGLLPGNARVECIAYIPAWDAQIDQSVNFNKYPTLLAAMKEYWDSFLSAGSTIELPDQQLTQLIKASRINCSITARNECDHTNIAPWVSAAHFGIIDSESQSIIEGMSLMGHRQFAQRGLDFFIRRYNSEGMVTSGYTLMGQGWHLRVLGQFFNLYHDQLWLADNQSKIASACEWIIRQSEKTKMLTPDGDKVLEYGLVPPGTAADWSLLIYNIRPQAEFYAGLKAAAEALNEIRHPKAPAYLQKAEELRTAIERSYRLTQRRCPAIPLSDGTWVPYCPAVATQFGSMADMIGSWVSMKDVSMGAQILVALGVLAPDAKDGYFKAEQFEDFEFRKPFTDFPASKIETDWFNYGGFYRGQPYYPRITDVYALNDDIKPFIRSYFNNIVPIVNMELLTFWEHFRASGGWNKTHETGWFLQQTRTMLIQEKGDSLWLAPFVPSGFMQDGMQITAENLPTLFGNVSLKIVSNSDKGVIHAQITPPARLTPESIVLRLRHPQQKRIKSVILNGKEYNSFDADKQTVHIKPGNEVLSVEARY